MVNEDAALFSRRLHKVVLILQAHVELIHRVFVPFARQLTQCVPQSGRFSFALY